MHKQQTSKQNLQTKLRVTLSSRYVHNQQMLSYTYIWLCLKFYTGICCCLSNINCFLYIRNVAQSSCVKQKAIANFRTLSDILLLYYTLNFHCLSVQRERHADMSSMICNDYSYIPCIRIFSKSYLCIMLSIVFAKLHVSPE